MSADGPRIRVVGPGCGGPSTLCCERCDWGYNVPPDAYVWEVWEVAVSHWDTTHMGVFAEDLK